MTLLKDNNYKDINVALLSLEADIKNKTGFDTSVIDKQLAEINSRIDKINAGGGNNSSDEIEDINSKLNSNSIKIRNIEQNIEDIGTQINGIEQKLSDIFSAENKVTDFNTTTNSGVYYWADDSANKPGTDYGVLLVNKYYGGDSATSLWINQIAYGTNNKIYFRQNINSTGWTGWKAVAFEGETATKVKYADYTTPTQTFTQFQQVPIELSKFSSEVTPNNVLCFTVIYWTGVQLIASGDWGPDNLICSLISLGSGTGHAIIRCVYMV